jgi:hypothetical protein
LVVVAARTGIALIAVLGPTLVSTVTLIASTGGIDMPRSGTTSGAVYRPASPAPSVIVPSGATPG